MNRAHWKEMLPIIQAFADGKDVAWLGSTIGSSTVSFASAPKDYTIVEPVNKWLKTGWVKVKGNTTKRLIVSYEEDSEMPYYVNNGWRSNGEMEDCYTPCNSPIGDNNE